MIHIDKLVEPTALLPRIERLFDLSAEKLLRIEARRPEFQGAPVYSAAGRYTSQGWTEWTQGFQFGSAILQFDATGDEQFLELGRTNTVRHMAPHVSHSGVHDHGFNNISTYGNLRRLMNEGRIQEDPWERNFYELALKISGAVQAARWTQLPSGLGYVYSFNGPHSLFSDTIRSMRSLAVSHTLGHALIGEKDVKVNLLERLLIHAETTARYNVFFAQGRDGYDICGRVAHESIFNLNDGSYRCPSSQQGFSPFTTWTRGLAWILLGYAEQLEFLNDLGSDEFDGLTAPEPIDKSTALQRFLEVARAVADFYIDHMPTDGMPYWDTGAPGLAHILDYRERPADPFNEYEPVDSSAGVIAAQGLLRLGAYLTQSGAAESGARYTGAGLAIAATAFDEPYISTSPEHEGLILHSVYHRPNGWDYIPPDSSIPRGEATMWGDYHARELALMIRRLALQEPYYRFG